MPLTTSLLSITLTQIARYLLALSAPTRACRDSGINLRLLTLECLWQEWGGQRLLPTGHEARPSSTLYRVPCLLQATVQWDAPSNAWFLGKDTKAWWRLDGDAACQRQSSSLNLYLHPPKALCLAECPMVPSPQCGGAQGVNEARKVRTLWKPSMCQQRARNCVRVGKMGKVPGLRDWEKGENTSHPKWWNI